MVMMKMVMVMGMTMMFLMQIRLPWQMGIFSPRLSKRTAAAPKEDDGEDLEVFYEVKAHHLGREEETQKPFRTWEQELSEPRSRIEI